ncbi:MAG: nucleotidyltransferase family protein [Lysobacteraceae bacterium]
MSASGQHIALVLAAGGSRRLGQPKQLLKRDGETLVHRACRLAMATSPQRLLLITGAHTNKVVAAVSDLALERVPNPDWERGLASSLVAAASVLPDDATRLLILGCDQPALSVDHLLRLRDTRARGEAAKHGNVFCAVTGYDDAVGMPAVVPAALLHSAVTAGDVGLRKTLNRLPPEQRVVVSAAELALDIDTAHDLQRARELGQIDTD